MKHRTARDLIDFLRSRPEITTPTGETMSDYDESYHPSVDHPDYDKPTAEAGPIKVTVGDLTANMIGEATIRIEHEGATIEGVLVDLAIDAETTALHTFNSGTPRAIVYKVGVGVTIGSIVLASLARDHLAEIVR